VFEATEGAIPEKVEPEAVTLRPVGEDEKDQAGAVSLVVSVPAIVPPWWMEVDEVKLADAVSPETVIAKAEVVAVVAS